jgi:hypothetical protein
LRAQPGSLGLDLVLATSSMRVWTIGALGAKLAIRKPGARSCYGERQAS